MPHPSKASRPHSDVAKRRAPSNDAAAKVRGVVRAAATSAAPMAALPPTAGDAPASNAEFQATALKLQEMHQVLTGQTFDHLLRVPGMAMPTRVAQGVHDAITQGVYAAVRHGGGAALSLVAGAGRLASGRTLVRGGNGSVADGAMNALVVDSLASAGNALAVQMGLHAGGAALTGRSIAELRPRVCVFIHGLACDERSWRLRTDAWSASPWAHALPADREVHAIHYGALLEHELGVSVSYLRYNTRLSIDANAQQLAALLERAAQAGPQVREWLLIGHSMGGLVARRAHAVAAAAGLAWVKRAPMIICLGSPQQAAAVDKPGYPAATALEVTEPKGAAGSNDYARRRGTKDLRRSSQRNDRTAAPPALRLVFATLGDASDTAMGSLIGKMFGDGLVMPASAADGGDAGDVQRVELTGLGHMSLLNHPRVYAVIRRWLGANEPAQSGLGANKPG